MTRPTSYGHDKPTALILKKMARERQHRTDLVDSVERLPQEITPLRSFIVYLDDVLPPATEDPTDPGTWIFEEGIGVVWGRNRLPGEENSQNPNYTVNNTWSPLRDDDNNCLRKRVFNPTQSEAPPCVPLQAVQDVYGDLYLVEVTPQINTSTTTPSPLDTLTPICIGQCKWTWSVSDNYWTLATDGCEPVETTTTSTTTQDPNQPFNPCLCDPSFVPNTTAAPQTYDCNCSYPTFCGTADGDCTYTICGSGYDLTPSACPGTTTSTTTTTTDPSTTTTTVDCNTTTVDPNCVLGCSWIHIPVQGVGYRLVENNCLGDCFCPYPDNIPEECVVVPVDCEPIPPGGPTCEGLCDFYWAAPLNTWYLLSDTCYGSAHCECRPPSMDGGVECGTFSFGCEYRATTTPNPCPTTTTTTTTNGPCGGVCEYGWDSDPGNWYLIDSTCTEGCECPGYPPFSGNDDCERQILPCVGDGTTSTTTTSTTTTTPVPCYCFDCYMQCVEDVWTSIGTPCGYAAGPSCVCYFDETTYSGTACDSMVDDYLDGKCRIVGQPWQSDECTSTTTPAPTTTTEAPIGACCYVEGTNPMCANMAEAACDLIPGTWIADTDCLSDPCADISGACCIDGVGCVYITEEACLGSSGTFQGIEAPCIPDPCPTTTTTTTTTEPPNGACCWDSGTQCSDVFETDCATNYADGVWMGPSSNCLEVGVCDSATTTTTAAPMGACCCIIGDCIGDMIEADCVGCTWYEGETCASFSCP